MHNNLDKQPVKQNTPIVAIGGCGQVLDHTPIITYLSQKSKSTTGLVKQPLLPTPLEFFE